MPSPSSTLSSLQPQLDTFYEYVFESGVYIAQAVYPPVNPMKQAGTFGKVPIEEMLKLDSNLQRSPGSGYQRDTMQFTDVSYATVEYGYEEIIDDREAQMYSSYFAAEAIATQRALNRMAVALEKRVATQLFNTATFTGAQAGSLGNGAWDVAASTPLKDVEAAVQKAYDNCGLWPNALIVNRKTFRELRIHSAVIASIASSGAGDQSRAGDVTTQQLAEVFDLPYILVGGGTQNTAAAGLAASPGQIWGNHAMVGRIATSEDMREPCLGRVIHWNEDGSMLPATLENYREEGVRGDVVRARHDTDELLIYKECGVLIPNVIT